MENKNKKEMCKKFIGVHVIQLLISCILSKVDNPFCSFNSTLRKTLESLNPLPNLFTNVMWYNFIGANSINYIMDRCIHINFID